MRRERFTALSGDWEGNRFRLSRDFTYRSGRGAITVPAGLVTDFDSVPRLPLVYWLFKNRSIRGAIVHDFLYHAQQLAGEPITRRQADAIFREAMADEGLSWWQRHTIWLGVRAGGFFAWRRCQALISRSSP